MRVGHCTLFAGEGRLEVGKVPYAAGRQDHRRFHVKLPYVQAAIAAAADGPVAEGAVGSGTGMICRGFKGGIGTASRVSRSPC